MERKDKLDLKSFSTLGTYKNQISSLVNFIMNDEGIQGELIDVDYGRDPQRVRFFVEARFKHQGRARKTKNYLEYVISIHSRVKRPYIYSEDDLPEPSRRPRGFMGGAVFQYSCAQIMKSEHMRCEHNKDRLHNIIMPWLSHSLKTGLVDHPSSCFCASCQSSIAISSGKEALKESAEDGLNLQYNGKDENSCFINLTDTCRPQSDNICSKGISDDCTFNSSLYYYGLNRGKINENRYMINYK